MVARPSGPGYREAACRATDHVDYSGTPLWKKLGIREGARVRVLDAPSALETELTAIAPLPDGVSFLSRTGRDLDVILAFVARGEHAAPADRAPRRRDRARGTALDRVAEARRPHRHRRRLRPGPRAGLDTGLVDNKSASITEVFQGLQFVRRKADR